MTGVFFYSMFRCPCCCSFLVKRGLYASSSGWSFFLMTQFVDISLGFQSIGRTLKLLYKKCSLFLIVSTYETKSASWLLDWIDWNTSSTACYTVIQNRHFFAVHIPWFSCWKKAQTKCKIFKTALHTTGWSKRLLVVVVTSHMKSCLSNGVLIPKKVKGKRTRSCPKKRKAISAKSSSYVVTMRSLRV